MSSQKKYKCPYCDIHLERNQLIDHIEDKHEDLIPESFTATRVVFSLVNKGKVKGNCVVCGKETKWNEDKGKYNRICENPNCRDKLRKDAVSNHIKVYGKETLLGDMEHQKKMLQGRHISGKYKFSDGKVFDYVGSYEHKFLEFCDKVMNIKSKDLMSPGPVIDYDFHGKKLEWITDFYYIPYNLVIEIKDGGDNPNTRTMEVYRDKQHLKEVGIEKLGTYNYIRLTNNQFDQLMGIFAELKDRMMIDSPNDNKAIIRIHEGTDLPVAISEKDVYCNMKSIKNPYNIIFITGTSGGGKSTLSKKICKEYKANLISMDDLHFRLWKYMKKSNRDEKETRNMLLEKLDYKGEERKLYKAELELIIKNFSELFHLYDDCEKWDDIIAPKFFERIFKWLIPKVEKEPELYVIEGTQCVSIVDIDKKYANYPWIFKSTSIGKASVRRLSRQFKSDGIGYLLDPNFRTNIKTTLTQSNKWKKEQDHIRHQVITNSNDVEYIEESTYTNEVYINDKHEYTFDYDNAKKGKPTMIPDGKCEFVYSPVNNTWNSILKKGNKIYRVRGEVLIINDKGEALVEYKKDYTEDADYMTPAGSMEPGLTLETCAAKECQEELRVVPRNMIYVGVYFCDFPQEWIDFNIHKNGIPYDGSVTYLYVAEYGKRYNGYVIKKDRSTMSDNAEWLDITKIKHPAIHTEAIHLGLKKFYNMNGYVKEAVENKPITESKYNTNKLYEAMDAIKEYLHKFNVKELTVDQTKTLESIVIRALDVMDEYDTKSEIFITSVLVAFECFCPIVFAITLTPLILAQVALIFKIPIDTVRYMTNEIKHRKPMEPSCIPVDTSKLEKGTRLICFNTHTVNTIAPNIPKILPALIHRNIPILLGGILPPLIEQYDARDFYVVDDRPRDNEIKTTDVSYKGKYLPIVACNDGIVVDTFESRLTEKTMRSFVKSWLYVLGNYVVIKHRDFYSVYGHLKKKTIVVKEGDIVKKGQQIAMMGKSGNSSGYHLHFELTYDNPNVLTTGGSSGTIGIPMMHFDYTAKVLCDHKDIMIAPDGKLLDQPIPKENEYKKYKNKPMPQFAIIKEESDMSVLDDYVLTESFLKNPFKKDDKPKKKTAAQIEREMKEKDKFYEECRQDLYNDKLFKEYIKGRTPEEVKKIKAVADKEMKSTIGDLKDEYKGSSAGGKVVVIMALIAIGVIPGAIPAVIIAKALGKNVKEVEDWIASKKKKIMKESTYQYEDQLSDLKLF